jgi:ribose 5-phosphate isomerase B
MRVVIASDHAGFTLKEDVREFISKLGHEVVDLGAHNAEPSDYPDFAERVGGAIMASNAVRGMLICGSGVGVSIAANKMPGIRSAICHDTYSAHQGVEHDGMNMLVMGSRIVGVALAHDITEHYLTATFGASEERFVRRLNKVYAIERRYMRAVEALPPAA